MFGLPRNAAILWLLVITTSAAMLAWSGLTAAMNWRLGLAALLFSIAGAIAETFRVPMPGARRGNRVETSVASAVFIAAVLTFPLHWAVLVVLVSMVAIQVAARQTAWYKKIFNASQVTLSASAAGIVWQSAGGKAPTDPAAIPWLLGTVLAYFVVNTGLVAGIVSQASGVPVRLQWWQTYRHVLPATLGMLLIGILIAMLWSSAPWTIALAAMPLAALFYALRNTVQLQTQTVDALFTLADILDARDPYTHGHSRRVGEYAERLAVALGRSTDQVQLALLAGRLHDIGKCAINNEVLRKPGPLDDAEREHMCQHPEVGGSMLAHFSMLADCAAAVRAHHERWDGAGYPDRLAGDAIPFVARIIAVTDSYDAMTTDRPYRRGLPQQEAIRRLNEGAGTQWDPAVVAAFVQSLKVGDQRVEEPAESLFAPSAGPAQALAP